MGRSDIITLCNSDHLFHVQNLNLEGLFLSKAKKIISMLLAVVMVVSVAPVSAMAAADANPVVQGVTYSTPDIKTQSYTIDTTATTEVIRVAAAGGSFSLGDGTGAAPYTIVSATPSGIPQNDGTYAHIAYAGETPVQPTVRFTIDGATLAEDPTIVASVTGISFGSTRKIPNGTATTYEFPVQGSGVNLKPHTDVVFTITYKIGTVSYNAYAYSHIEDIIVMNGWLNYHKVDNSTGKCRYSAIGQFQSINMYTRVNAFHQYYENVQQSDGTFKETLTNDAGGTVVSNKTRGYINYATTSANQGNVLLGCGSEGNFDGTINAYGSAVPNGAIAGDERAALVVLSQIDDGDYSNKGTDDDSNRGEPIIYMDYNDTLQSLNFRFTLQNAERTQFGNLTLNSVEFFTPGNAPSVGEDTGSVTGNVPTDHIATMGKNYGNTSSATITGADFTINGTNVPFGAYVMAKFSGRGPKATYMDAGTQVNQADTSTGNPYHVWVDIVGSGDNRTINGLTGMNLVFRNYDTRDLRALYEGTQLGTGSYTCVTPSYKGTPIEFNKGVTPRREMYDMDTTKVNPYTNANYTGQEYDDYVAALKAAGSVLAQPDTSQAEIDAVAANLYNAYYALPTPYATVSYTINHYLDGTKTPVTVNGKTVLPQTGTAPMGSVINSSAATIVGHKAVGTTNYSTDVTGKVSSVTIDYYYEPENYNITYYYNNPSLLDADGKVNNNDMVGYSYNTKVDIDAINRGTREHYDFLGWYDDNYDVYSSSFTATKINNGTSATDITVTDDDSLYALWKITPIKVYVTPVTNQGVELTANKGTLGNPVQLTSETDVKGFADPGDYNIDGYFFGGYYYNYDAATMTFSNPVDWSAVEFRFGDSDLEVYARMIDVNGRISFNSNGGSDIPDISFSANETVRPEGVPTRKGYTFKGWWNEDFTVQYFENGTEANGWTDGTEYMANNTGFLAYAKWEANFYNITFEMGDPTSDFDTTNAQMPILRGPADDPIDPNHVPPEPTKFGKTFAQWVIQGTSTVFTFDKYPTEDIVLVPVWNNTKYSAFISIGAYEKLSGGYEEVVNPTAANREGAAQLDDIVTFRMTSQTNFYTGSSVFVFMYDKSFFELVDDGTSAFLLNKDNEYIKGIDATAIGVTDDSLMDRVWPNTANMDRKTYNAMMVTIDPTITSTNHNCEPMADGTWLVEFQLRVKDAAGKGEGTVYMHNDWTRTADNIMGTMFYGWAETNDTSIANTFNNVVEPNLSKATATITLDPTPQNETTLIANPNGGSWADGSTSSVTFTGYEANEIMDYESPEGVAFDKYVSPTREGYNLTGWVKSDNESVTWEEEGFFAKEAQDGFTFNAQWEAEMFTVNYYLEEGNDELWDSEKLAYDSPIDGPFYDIEKEGYDFAGWVDSEGNPVTIGETLVPLGGIDLYATWTPGEVDYTVVVNYFNNNSQADTTLSRTRKALTGSKVYIVEAAGTDAGATYVLWSELPAINGYEFDPSNAANQALATTPTVIAADGSTVINVYYKAKTITYTFDANGGAYADNLTTQVISGEFQTATADKVATLKTPVREGYEFKGWNATKNLADNGTAGSVRANFTTDTTYYAAWSAAKADVLFNAGDGKFADGTSSTPVEQTYGKAITAPAAPTRDGYNFLGWSTDGSTVLPDLGTMNSTVDNEIVFIAVWDIAEYDVTYIVDGQQTATSKVEYKSTITVADYPADILGYSFDGWYYNGTKYAPGATIEMPAGAVVLEGNFTKDTFKATFKANGGTFSDGSDTYSTDVIFGGAITVPSAPARNGYEFLGWTDKSPTSNETVTPGTMNEEGKTYYAVWKATIWDYTIEFYYMDTNGGYGAAAEGETIEAQGNVASTASYQPAAKTGFTIDAAMSTNYDATANTVSGTVTVEPALVLKVYYSRNQYKVYTTVDGNRTEAGTFYYEEAVSIADAPDKTGYTFSAWSPAVPATMPAQNQELTAHYTANPYPVVFYKDANKAETLYDNNIAYGTALSGLVPDPTMDGYTFKGWAYEGTTDILTLANETVPVGGVTLVGIWEIETYTVNFRANNGTYEDGTNYKSTPVAFGNPVVAPEVPTREGHSFTGWAESIAGAIVTLPDAIADGSSVRNYFAQWAVESYEVEFVIDTDNIISDTYEYGADIAVPDETQTVKTGWTFQHWVDEEGNKVDEVPTTMGDIGETGDKVTYTAYFTIDSHNVTWNNENGSVYEGPVSYEYGAAVSKPAKNPEKTGWTFMGWKAADGTLYKAETAVPAMGTADVTYTAYFEINSYEVTWVFDNDTANQVDEYDFNEAVTKPADPEKTGYTFAGWKDNAGNSYAVGEGVPAMIAEDVTYTAQWTINQYEVTWVFDNGDEAQVDEYDFEEAVTKPADPEKTGYTFAGWKDNAGNSYAVGAAVPAMIAEDVTYTAQWTVNGYKVTWVYNDGVTEDVVETYNYGATINAPATPDKKVGYTFNSWSPAIDATMPAYDVTYTATWDANSYDAVFNANGGEWADGETTKTVSTKFDANIDTTTVGLTKDDAAAPTKAGYVFAGWDPAVGTMNSVDGLTFTAKWVNATDTRYTVITYTMNTEGQHVETDRDILTGETGASVDATPANLGAGFKFNAEKSSATGNILADSSLVLEVYIDRETYTLTTIVDDVTTPTKYLFEQTVSVTQPSKTGYDFAGWVDADNSAATVPATMPANDVTLKATWDARNDTVFYVVMNYTDDLSGDVTVEDKYELAGTTASTIAVVEEVPAEAAENTTYVLISDIESYFSGSFAINHYDFDKADSDVKVLADGTAEVNVYYVPAEYEITFSSGTGKFEDGETSKTVTLKYNQLVKENAPADPAKDGYTFKGYNGLTDTTRVAGKRTFTATYEANTYKLTWVIDKDTDNIQSSDVATDTLISAPAVNDSMKEGYKFMGWSDVEGGTTEITVPNAMPAGDSTYYAIWQIQQYKVTFYNEKGDAESIFTTTADYATEYTVPTASKTGYTFDKWMNAETDAVVTFTDGKGTIPSADTSYYATWTINQYTISFDTDGGSPVADIKQNYATPVTAPSDPTKIGYTFKGWATTKGADESAKVDLPTEMPAEDQTYYAIWVIDKYEIKFDSQGGSNVDTVKADYNSQVAEPTAPTKDGYTFKGWATTAGVTDAAQAVAFPVTMPLNGTTYYAIWETNNYTITFDSKGGSAVSSIEQPYLSSVAKPADPTLEGYTFGGWSATDGGTEAIAFPVEMPLNGATYYAIWTIESYTVNWINEGTTAKSETVNYKGALTAPEVTKTGYKLEGWYDADGNKAPATISDIGNTGAAITYTAKWTANTYDAIFDANGGAWGTETTKTVPTAFDQPIVAPENPSRAGYTFSTWEPAVGTMNSVDGLTFKAVWVADSDTKYTVETYTMNTSGTYDMTPEVKGAATDSVVNVKPASVADGFVLNDTLSVYEGQVLADNSLVLKVYIDRKSYNFNTAVAGGTTTTATPYLFGATVVVPEEEAKTGYTFDGWYYGDVKYTAGADFTMPAKDVTLTGTLTINKYTATWVFDNGTPDKVETYEYNATIVAPADPEKTGYTFASWSPEVDATMPAGDVTYTAQWTPNQYTITFENTGDTTIAPITQAYLSDVTAPADPEKAGHTFAGWLDKDGNKVSVPAKMPLDGMTLTADWTVNKYLVTFYKDAEKTETVYSNEVEFGASLNGLTADPTKEGHTFAGWAYEGTTTKLDLAKETVPVGGVNLVALWTVNNVKLVYRTYNGVYEEYEVPFGTAKADIPVPADPERDGWTFTGWNIALPETMPATQVTRVAQWKQETYTINWVSDGEKVTGDEFIASAVYGDELTAPEMSKTGYTFGGWDYNGATYAAGDAITIADAGADGAEITITAKWTANTYDAIFDANGGAWADNDTTKTVPTVFDQAIVAPENPSRAGYTFGTWEPTVGNMTAEGMTFKAVWVAKGDTQYKVITYTMNTDGDYVADNNGDGVIYTAATDSVVNVKPASVAEGFALNDSKSVYEGKVLADNSLVLKVYIDRETYTVTTTLDGTVTGTQDVLFGATVAVPADGVKEGYKFNGWTVNGTAYESNATFEMPAKDVAIVGTYTVNQYDAVFYVDGTVFATVPTNFGEVPAAPDATNAKPGYTFVEWTPALAAMTTAGAEYNAVFTAKGDTPYTVEIYTMGLDGNYGEAAVENYTGATDTEATYAPVAKEGFTVADTSVLKGNISADGKLVLKVYYSRNDYTITYNVDGEEYKVETYKYGADITILEAPKKEGHTFSGWDSTLDATMPAENLVINGTFSANDYTITYNVDGAEYKVETHKYGDDITILEAPKKEGHTFSGWDSSLPATMPAENLVISGTFSPNTYKITYMIDGAEHKVEEYVFGTPVTTLKAPEKEGYTFSGWDKNAPETMTAGDITISGTFTVNQYDAIFYVDGAVFATVPTNFGEVPAAPDATNAKAGYTFVEWTPALAAMTTAGAEYNAVFTANSGIGYVVKTYKMNTDGETYTMTEEDFTGTAGDTATYAVKTLEGFTFEKGTNYNEDANTISGTISGDGTLVLEVYYTRNKANVNINGEEEEKYYGEEIEEPTPVPEEEIPDGYEQDGWVDENGDPVEFPVTVGTEDIVIKPNIVPSEYTATFVFDDGTTEEKAIAYLSTVTAPDAPAKEGYKFIGWRDDTNKFLTSTTTMPARDITYTAIYEITTSVVIYYVDGEVVGAASYEYGAEILTSIPTYTTSVGYELDGWYTDSAYTTKLADGATFGSGITALYGKEVAKTYDAIFMVDGEVYKTVPTAFDADIVAPEAPTKDGYTFAGWDPYVGTMDKEGMTFTAQWVNNEYTITYIVDGEVYDEFAVEFGGEFEIPSEPDKAGYAFLGWASTADATAAETLPEFMPAENLTYYAVFEITERTATFYGYEALDASPYKSADAVELSSEKFNVGAAIEFPADPTNIDSAYWTFLGWSATENGEIIADTSAVIMGEEDVSFYAVYEKVKIKLVPADDSDTVIERDGEIECHLDGTVTDVPYETPDSFDEYYIYGLTAKRINESAIRAALKIIGDGRLNVIDSEGGWGTGTIVELYDKNGTEDEADDILVEQFYIVIFGDFDGNTRINAIDSSILQDEVASPDWSKRGSQITYLVKAADLDGNRRVNAMDLSLHKDVIARVAELDQIYGEVI